MKYDAAADGGRWQRWNARGRPTGYKTRVPEPWVHAVAEESTETVCGRETAGLEPFPRLSFNSVHPDLRCPDCRLIVER